MPARRNRRSRRRLLGVAVLALLGLAGLVVAGREAWWRETERSLRPADTTDESLVVPPGASAEWMARQLQALGFVRHPLVFRVYVESRGVGTGLRAGEYALVTLHRPANVDDPGALAPLLAAIGEIAQVCPVVLPAHPRAARQLEDISPQVQVIPPAGYRGG